MLKGIGLEYEIRGDGEAVFLIHGSHVAESFLPLTQEAALADRYRLIRYHRRGFAGSAPVSAPFSVEEQAHDALMLVRHLAVQRAHVIGHSYGGAISLQLALDAPDLVHSLVLLEPALMMVPSAPALFEAVAPAVDRYASGDVAGAVDAFMRLVGGPGWRSEIARTVPGGAEQAEKDGATFFEVELPAIEKWAFDAARASRISQPVLYVIGTESGAFFEEGKQLVHSWLRQTEEAVIPGANHLLQMHKPGLVAQGISEFLARHPL